MGMTVHVTPQTVTPSNLLLLSHQAAAIESESLGYSHELHHASSAVVHI